MRFPEVTVHSQDITDVPKQMFRLNLLAITDTNPSMEIKAKAFKVQMSSIKCSISSLFLNAVQNLPHLKDPQLVSLSNST